MKGVKSDKWNEKLEAVEFDDSVSKKNRTFVGSRKIKAVEVRENSFQKSTDVTGSLNARLTKSLFSLQANKFYGEGWNRTQILKTKKNFNL